MQHQLFVTVKARSRKTVEAMVDQLCRAACDIANSTEDDHARVIVEDCKVQAS